MAESLVASMAGDFDPDAYSDDYREALQQVIDAKIEGREVVETPQAEPTAGNVVDLMAALRASVEAAKRSRGESCDSAGEDGAREDQMTAKASTKTAPAKKAPAKKAPASKTAAKKAPAKKAAAKATWRSQAPQLARRRRGAARRRA